MTRMPRLDGLYWGTPRDGVVIATADMVPDAPEIAAGDIFIRAAGIGDHAASGMSVQRADQILRDHARSMRDNVVLTWPTEESFIGTTQERIAAEQCATANERMLRRPYPAVRFYEPLVDATGLFREFAASVADVERIVRFAQEYGTLTLACPLLVWQEEVLAMRRALTIWNLLNAGALDRLRQHFIVRRAHDDWQPVVTTYKYCYLTMDSHPHLGSGKQPPYPDRRAIECLSSFVLSHDQWDRVIEDTSDLDVAAVAKEYLRLILDDRFGRYVESKLGWSDDHMGRVFRPKHLLGALWLQFEQSITGRKTYRACAAPGCGRWFEVSPGVARSDKKYCDDGCRVVAHQHRNRTGKRPGDVERPTSASPRLIGKAAREKTVRRRAHPPRGGRTGQSQDEHRRPGTTG